MPKRSYKHIDWQSLRDLIAKGVTLKELAKTFDINYRSLQVRSYRERWNVAAIRANLPPRSKTERKDSREPVQLLALRNGVLLPLVKLANYYQAADVATLRKEQRQFLAFANTAIKALASNDPKHAEGNSPVVNLTLLAARPAELVAAHAREVVADSKSSAVATSHEGNPDDGKAVCPDSASDSLG